jgi:hypothetical protein
MRKLISMLSVAVFTLSTGLAAQAACCCGDSCDDCADCTCCCTE